MIRAVLDAGVLVAAAITPRGLCGQLLRAMLDGRFVMILCPALLAELERVLLRPKFRRYLSVEEARRFTALVAAAGELHPDPAVEHGLTRDPSDDYLVALARAAGAAFLVSGDLDLTELEEPDPPLLTPREFFEHVSRIDVDGPTSPSA